MFYIKIAELVVRIHNVYPFVQAFCKDYITDPVDDPDLVVETTEEEIQRVLEIEGTNLPADRAEGLCIYKKICLQLPKKFNGFFMHCAVIEYHGKGYAFAAPSGTGKSTHIRLWRKKFGDAVHVINGDKPIMRFDADGHLIAYGTPWCGKEGYQTNASVPLKAICFIERSESNRIHSLSAKDAVSKIFHQILLPTDRETVDALFPMLDKTIREIPCYVLECNISEEAAEIAYCGMNASEI